MDTAILAILGTIMVSIVGLAYWMGRKFANMDLGLRTINGQLNSHLTLIGSLIRILYKRNALTLEEFSEIQSGYSTMATAHLGELKGGGNPLTPQETQRLNSYVLRARRGEFFQPWEVDDYYALVHRMEEERPRDPDIWPLVALGAFLLGLYLGSRKKEEESR